jgi:4'-phosphopantetheinyl transferase EntD
LLGRHAAKETLREHLNEPDISKINITAGIFQHPVILYPMADPWQVSISHCDSVACAIAFPAVHPMAVDVEELDPDRMETMASQSVEGERTEVRAAGLSELQACALLWTAKEALSKTLHTGMTCPFEMMEVHSVKKVSVNEFEGLYRNFAQYKFHSWFSPDHVLTFVLPKRTQIEFKPGPPRLDCSNPVISAENAS